MPRRHTLALALKVIAGLFVALLMVEGAMRVRHRIRFGTFDRLHRFESDPATGLTIPRREQHNERINTNSLGFRGPEIDEPKPPGRVRIVFLGGSTTFCAEATRDETTWPYQVWQRIQAALPQQSFDFVNAGVGGYTLTQIQANLERRVAPLEPDVVVIYEATNDLAHDTRELARAQGLYADQEDQESWLERLSLTWFLVEKNLAARRRVHAATHGNDHLRCDLDELARAFEERLVELVRAAQARAELVVLVTFCPRLRHEQAPDQLLEASAGALYFMPYMTPELLRAGFDAYNGAIRRAAERTGAVLVEAEGLVPADGAHYNDTVHFKDPGLALFASRVADGLLASQGFRELVR